MNSKLWLAVLSAASAIAIASSASAATNLIQNGGFENDSVPGPYYNIGPAGADHPVPGDFKWQVSKGNVDIISYAPGAYGPAPANGGLYGLDLVGYGSTGEISQDITTAAGTAYNVTFDYRANPGVTDPTAEVLFDGNSVGSVTGGTGWQVFHGVIDGNGASSLFALNETFGGNNGGVFLDNISVSAVPEPATWAMMLFGVGLVGAGLRMGRRDRRSAIAV